MREFDVEAVDYRRSGKTLFALEDVTRSDKGYARGPERALLSALLFDGVQSYLMYATSARGAGRTKYREAYNWIENRSREYIFAFDSVCEALGIDPEYLRCGLMNVMTSRSNEWKRSRRNF